jgi:hypothetical protein
MATTVLTMTGREESGGQQRPGRTRHLPRLGDLSWFSDNITAISKNGANVPLAAPAHESGFCIFVRDANAPGGAAWLCQGGFELPGGQIHSRALTNFAVGGPDYVVHAAILGGTGLYNRAMGQIETTWHSAVQPKTTTDWVMTIES